MISGLARFAFALEGWAGSVHPSVVARVDGMAERRRRRLL